MASCVGCSQLIPGDPVVCPFCGVPVAARKAAEPGGSIGNALAWICLVSILALDLASPEWKAIPLIICVLTGLALWSIRLKRWIQRRLRTASDVDQVEAPQERDARWIPVVLILALVVVANLTHSILIAFATSALLAGMIAWFTRR